MNVIQTKSGSISFEDLLEILNPPELDPKNPVRFLRWKGNLSRCLDHLNRTFPELVARVISPVHLSEIISPYLDMPEDERGREISGHAATGRLPDHNPVYVILTPHGLASSDPEVKNLFRAIIFILAITHYRQRHFKKILQKTHIQNLSSLIRDDEWNLVNFLSSISLSADVKADFTEIRRALDSDAQNILSQGRRKAVNWLIDAVEGNTHAIKPHFSKPSRTKQPRRKKKSHRVLTGRSEGKSPVAVVGAPPKLPKEVLNTGEGLPFADILEDPPLIRTEGVAPDEAPQLRSLDRARATRGYERWVTGFFLNSSDSTLTANEAVKAVSALYTIAESAIGQKKVDRAEAALTLLLVISTSQAPSYIIDTPNLDAFPAEDILEDEESEGISPSNGLHLFRVPGCDDFWKPKDSDSDVLRKTSPRLQLHLPDQITRLLSKLHPKDATPQSGYLFSTPPESLHKKTIELSKEVRREEGVPRFTIERIRHYLPTRLHTRSNDISVVQMVTGQDWGFSTAPSHYWCAPQEELQKSYDQAVESMFVEIPKQRSSRSYRYDIPDFVGSHMQLDDDEVHQYVAQLKLLAAPQKRTRKKLAQWLSHFSDYTRYFAFLILGGTAHRDSSALRRITSNDFDTSNHMGLIADKVYDPGQRARLIALPEMLCHQIERYRAECLALSVALKSTPASALKPHFEVSTKAEIISLAQVLENAATGKGALLIRFDRHLRKQDVDNAWLKLTIPDHWDVRLNFLRHRSATKLREIVANRQLIHYQLGHFSSGVQPFGRSGILVPKEFVHRLAPDLNTMLSNDGWKCIGYKPDDGISSEPELSWLQARTLSNRYQDVQKGEREKFRENTRRRIIRRLRSQVTLDATTISVLKASIDQFDPDNPPADIKLEDSDIDRITSILLEDVQDNKDQLEWRIDTLRKHLGRLRDKHGWITPMPSRLFRPYIEPSPFFIGGLSALKTIEQIQNWLIKGFPDYKTLLRRIDFKARKPNETEYKIFRLACFLVFVEGFFKEDHLIATLKGISDIQRPRNLSSILIMPREIYHKNEFIAEVGERLSGVTAVVAARVLTDAEKPTDIPTLRDLSSWLYAALPRQFKTRNRTQCWKNLSEIAAIGRRFQVSGMAHAIESGEMLTLGVPAKQLVEIIDQLPGTSISSAQPEISEAFVKEEFLPVITQKSASIKSVSKLAIKQYNQLTKTLYFSDSEAKHFPHTETTLSPSAFKSQLVPGIKKELKAWLRSEEHLLTDPIRALTHWALYLLGPDGRIDKRGTLKVSTVHTYVTRFGRSFVSLFQTQTLQDCDADFFEENYLELLLSKPLKSRYEVLSSLLRFHRFISYKIPVDPIEAVELYAVTDRFPDYPEVGILSERQFQASLSAFNYWLDANTAESTYDQRIIHAAKLIWLLMFRNGLRASEAYRLRFCDFLTLDQLEHILIQHTGRSTTKTTAGKRSIPFFDRLDEREKELLITFLQDERVRRHHDFMIKDHLFSQRDHAKLLLDRQTLFSLISTAIRWAASSDKARPHWGRGSFASHSMLLCGISREDFESIQKAGSLRPITSGKVRSLRDLCGQWQGQEQRDNKLAWEFSGSIGHASPITTNTIYSHLNNLWENPTSLTMWSKMNGREQAEFSGISYGEYRKRRARKDLPRDAISSPIAVAIDQLAGSYFKRKYTEAFPILGQDDFPKLPESQKVFKNFDLINLFDLLQKMETGVPFNALASGYSFSTDFSESLLATITRAQIACRFAIVSRQRIVDAYETIGKNAPTRLQFMSIDTSQRKLQKARVEPILDKLDSMLGVGSHLPGEALQAVYSGQRIGDSSIALQDLDLAGAFIKFLLKIGVTRKNIQITIKIIAVESENLEIALIEEYAGKMGLDIAQVSIEHKDTTSNYTIPRIVVQQAGKNAIGKGLWASMVVTSVYLDL